MTDLHEIELNVALEQWSRLGPTATGFVSPMVTKLEKAGLLNVSLITPEDPIWNVTLTDAGRERLTRMGVLPGRDETEKAQPAKLTGAGMPGENNIADAIEAAFVAPAQPAHATDAAARIASYCPRCGKKIDITVGCTETHKDAAPDADDLLHDLGVLSFAGIHIDKDDAESLRTEEGGELYNHLKDVQQKIAEATARAERAEAENKRLREAIGKISGELSAEYGDYDDDHFYHEDGTPTALRVCFDVIEALDASEGGAG